MKRTEIRAGVVYAMTSERDPSSRGTKRAVVLDAANYYQEVRGAFRSDNQPEWSYAPSKGPTAANPTFVGAQGMGWLVAIEHGKDITDADLLAVDLAAVRASTRANPYSVPGIRIDIVNSADLRGFYDDVMDGIEAAEQIAALARRAEAARKADVKSRWQTARDALIALGITGLDDWPLGGGRVALTPDQIDALVALIPEGARVPVAEESWEYAAPEGVGASVHVVDEEAEPEPAPAPKPRPNRKPRLWAKADGRSMLPSQVSGPIGDSQGSVVAVASYKDDIDAMVAATDLRLWQIPMARLDHEGDAVKALIDAGLIDLDTPRVLAFASIGRHGDAIVDISADGQPVVGYFRRSGDMSMTVRVEVV